MVKYINSLFEELCLFLLKIFEWRVQEGGKDEIVMEVMIQFGRDMEKFCLEAFDNSKSRWRLLRF